ETKEDASSDLEERVECVLRSAAAAGIALDRNALDQLAAIMKNHAIAAYPFYRLDVPVLTAREMFMENPLKLEAIDLLVARLTHTSSLGDEPLVPIYRTGPFVDISEGPHVRTTKQLAHCLLTNSSSVYWPPAVDRAGGNIAASAQGLRRVFAAAFPSAKALDAWQAEREEAARRDHRLIGRRQELFCFHPSSPGSAFFLPHGVRIVSKLLEMIRDEYRRRGFDEVMTPQLYKRDLWKRSGHWENYKDDMFTVVCGDGKDVGGSGCAGEETRDEYGLKPMNCPGHCLLFAETQRSHRDLPIRLADFSALHRNEAAATSGLARVRRFHQDDAHIFCTEAQISSEISSTLDFIHTVYARLGLPSYNLYLSTRPTSHIGTGSEWDNAEGALREALNGTGRPWEERAGDGAFYGPKIDVVVRDAVNRQHQTATVQLDFQLPSRFDLEYVDAGGMRRKPVIIHRAVLGSLERAMAILIEHTAGKWPFWISPRQALVVPVSPAFNAYAGQVCETLRTAGGRPRRAYHVDLADIEHGQHLSKQVFEAQQIGYNYVLVVGEREQTSGTVTVRKRGDGAGGKLSAASSQVKRKDTSRNLGEMRVDEVLDMFVKLEDEYL
ncbi:MAG: hypothetical protein BJ554DRAFT_4775, partial [Olpidium bornovanus]